MKTSQLVLYDRVLESPPGAFDEEVLLGLWMAGRVEIVSGALPSSCWQWTGYQQNGYPMYSREYAHRKAYKEIVGDVTSYTVLHHECRMPLCVRPSHLRPMNWSEHAQLHQKRTTPKVLHMLPAFGSFEEWARYWVEHPT